MGCSVGCRGWVQEEVFVVLLLVAIAGTDIYHKAKRVFVVEGGPGLLPTGFVAVMDSTAPVVLSNWDGEYHKLCEILLSVWCVASCQVIHLVQVFSSTVFSKPLA
jgi:hypothetical protein